MSLYVFVNLADPRLDLFQALRNTFIIFYILGIKN